MRSRRSHQMFGLAFALTVLATSCGSNNQADAQPPAVIESTTTETTPAPATEAEPSTTDPRTTAPDETDETDAAAGTAPGNDAVGDIDEVEVDDAGAPADDTSQLAEPPVGAWTLLAFTEGGDGPQSPPVDSQPGIDLGRRGDDATVTLSGVGGCNSFSGTATIGPLDGSFRTGPDLAMTEMGCVPFELNDFDGIFTGLLARVTGYVETFDELVLSGDGVELRFERPITDPDSDVELEGPGWRLDTLYAGSGDDATASSAVVDSDATLSFRAGDVSGWSGCNELGGSYELNASQLRFGSIESTEEGCDPALSRQESGLLAALEQTRSWRGDGSALILSDGADDLARFVSE